MAPVEKRDHFLFPGDVSMKSALEHTIHVPFMVHQTEIVMFTFDLHTTKSLMHSAYHGAGV